MGKRSIAKHNSTKKRRNFLPTLILTILFWLVLAGVVYFIDPATFGTIYFFFAVTFLALLFTFSLLFGNTRRGVITSIALISFLILRYLGIGHILNFLLIAGLAIVIEMLYSR